MNDPIGRYGLANLTAEMLTRGTATHTSQEVAQETDFVGAQIGVSAGRERTVFTGRMLSLHFEQILSLLADILRNPNFPAAQVEKARGEVLTALQEQEDDTAQVAVQGLYTALYSADNPYQHPPLGTKTDLANLTADDLRAFHQQWYRPDQITLVIVGDIQTAQARAAVEKLFGDWQPNTPRTPEHPTSNAQSKIQNPKSKIPNAQRLLHLPVADKTQNDLAVGLIGLSRQSPDYAAASLMNLMLGGDLFVGRVGKRIRDTEGLAYYAFTRFTADKTPGPWMFRAGVNPKNVAKALQSAQEEIGKIATQGLTAEDLAWAKDHAIGAQGLTLATNGGQASFLAVADFFGLGLDYAERYPKIVRGLTKAQVDATARKYLRPDALMTVIAGPPVPGLPAQKP